MASPPAPRAARAQRLVDVAALLLVGVAYVLTSSRHLLGGDAGELAAGGVLHPPGYPLFALVQRAFGWLPAASPAHRAALVTALVATLSVAALLAAARAWGASRPASLFVALLYAAGPLAWDLATHAEVFALNVLVAMVLVALSAEAPPRGSETWRAVLLTLFAGLGLANHHSIVLLAPLGLFAFGRAVWRSSSPARTCLLSVGALAIGLSPYAYLVLVARATPVGEGCIWGDPRTLQGLLDHFLRREYGTTQLGISDTALEPIPHVLALCEQLVTDLPSSLVVLAVGGAAAARMRRRPSPALVLLVVSLLLAGPVFASRFNLPPYGVALLVTERFHLLPLALTAVLLALALDACARALREEQGAPSKTLVRAVLALSAVVVIARAGVSYGALRERQDPGVDLWLHDVMAQLPPRSIVLHSGDHRVGAFLYARCALHERPDVTAIAPRLLLTDWYPPEISAQLGLPVVHGHTKPGAPAPSLASRALVEQLVATGRPVFLTDLFAPSLAPLPIYPVGSLLRVAARPEDLPPLPALVAENEAIFAAARPPAVVPARETWAAFPASDRARTWSLLAGQLAASGDAEGAARCAARAASLAPR